MKLKNKKTGHLLLWMCISLIGIVTYIVSCVLLRGGGSSQELVATYFSNIYQFYTFAVAAGQIQVNLVILFLSVFLLGLGLSWIYKRRGAIGFVALVTIFYLVAVLSIPNIEYFKELVINGDALSGVMMVLALVGLCVGFVFFIIYIVFMCRTYIRNNRTLKIEHIAVKHIVCFAIIVVFTALFLDLFYSKELNFENIGEKVRLLYVGFDSISYEILVNYGFMALSVILFVVAILKRKNVMAPIYLYAFTVFLLLYPSAEAQIYSYLNQNQTYHIFYTIIYFLFLLEGGCIVGENLLIFTRKVDLMLESTYSEEDTSLAEKAEANTASRMLQGFFVENKSADEYHLKFEFNNGENIKFRMCILGKEVKIEQFKKKNKNLKSDLLKDE